MGDQLDNRPVFTIVMGCDGAGKSAWKVKNRDRLPERYFDKDSIANGVGGWDTPNARQRTDEYVDAEIAKALAGRYNFGIESTYSRRPGPELVERAIEAGYRVEGIFIGTENPEVNVERIRSRVEKNTGHYVDPERVPDCYRQSLHNLRRTADRFDELTIVDNTEERERGIPDPRTELVLEKGRTAWEARDPGKLGDDVEDTREWRCVRIRETAMEQRQTWIAAAAVIATVIGATWVIGQNVATREGMTRLRNEAAQQRNEIKAEIRAARESGDAQMEELRGYIVQHLEEHGRDSDRSATYD